MLEAFFEIFQSFIDVISIVFEWVTNLLPMSPFLHFNSITLDNELLGFIAWLVPFTQILSLLQTWIVCVGFYYAFMVIMRWIKLLE